MEIIGRGERTAIKIIRELIPGVRIRTQVQLVKLLTPEFREGLSDRQLKESIDIVVERNNRKPLCVRIQDRHHFSTHFSRIDKAQQHLLKWSHNDVIDVVEYECPELFKDELNVNSRQELKKYLKPYL